MVDRAGVGAGGGGSVGDGGEAVGRFLDESAFGAVAGGCGVSGEEYDGLFSVGDVGGSERDIDGGVVFGGEVEAVSGE